MAYKDERQNKLDLSCSGRGLQQTLLLFGHLYSKGAGINNFVNFAVWV
jgi:hypothetical protein